MFPEVLHIDGHSGTGYKHLELILTEEAEPVERDHTTQALSERLELSVQLYIQLVVTDLVDVLNAVTPGDRDLSSTWLQLNHLHTHKTVPEEV